MYPNKNYLIFVHTFDFDNSLTVTDFRLTPRDFNSYGSRRGNDAVMARGTFANIRLVNKLASATGPRTLHIPSGEEVLLLQYLTFIINNLLTVFCLYLHLNSIFVLKI